MLNLRCRMCGARKVRRVQARRRCGVRGRSYLAHRARRMRGLTLLELLLALAGTAVIGTAVTAMVSGVIYGTATDRDMRSLITRQMALRSRVEAEVREARLLLDSGADYLVLWSSDADDDGLPDNTEIQVIEYDPVAGQVTRYTPGPLLASADLGLDDPFRTITNGYKAAGTFQGTPWGEQITSFNLTLDHLDPQSARLVAFRFGMAGGQVPYTGIGAATIRNEVSP